MASKKAYASVLLHQMSRHKLAPASHQPTQLLLLTVLSPMCTAAWPPCCTRSLRSSGYSTASTLSTSATTSVLPNLTASSSVVEKRASPWLVTSTALPPEDCSWAVSHLRAWGQGAVVCQSW